jgi:hypothetical protein
MSGAAVSVAAAAMPIRPAPALVAIRSDREDHADQAGFQMAARIKWAMKTLSVIVALLSCTAMAAEQPKKKPAQVTANPCAQYGAGFVQVPGTATCIKASGSIRVDMGVQSNGR